MYFVYILASRRHGTLYIGVTNSVQKRLKNIGTAKGPCSSRNTASIVSST